MPSISLLHRPSISPRHGEAERGSAIAGFLFPCHYAAKACETAISIRAISHAIIMPSHYGARQAIISTSVPDAMACGAH